LVRRYEPRRQIGWFKEAPRRVILKGSNVGSWPEETTCRADQCLQLGVDRTRRIVAFGPDLGQDQLDLVLLRAKRRAQNLETVTGKSDDEAAN
jgi:hypothetical protein